MKPTCLHELFEFQADCRPSEVALVCDGECFSYQELEDLSNQYAHYLRSCGVGPGILVGLYFERSVNPFIALLATLKAGAGYVPLDPNFSLERIRRTLKHADVPLLVTEQSLSKQAVSIFQGSTVLVDTRVARISKQSTDRLSPKDSGVCSSDLCYVIYTSGTTSQPKGVMAEHRNVISFVKAFNEVCQVNEMDRIYQGFSLAWDGSVEEIWMAFSTGATLVVPSEEIVGFPNEAARFITENQITYLDCFPTFLSAIEQDLPTIRLLLVTGEPCPLQLVEKWAKPGRRMLNVYGFTEAIVNASTAELVPGKPVTIGRPLPSYESYILDHQLRPVSPGQTGELCIAGPTVARGYFKQPEYTAERFVVNPYNETGKSPWLYRSGDLVRSNKDGELEILGRIDGQVKICGFRIELSEIEAVLLEHPSVRTAVVNKVIDYEGAEKLAAYVVPDLSEGSFDQDGVLGLLRTRLPDYMLPGYLDLIDEIPTTPIGKVDRARLPEPKRELPSFSIRDSHGKAVITTPASWVTARSRPKLNQE